MEEEVIEVPVAPGNPNCIMVPRFHFDAVKVVKLEFVGDHGLMKANDADWTSSGASIVKPEFEYGKKSAPVSYTKGQELSVKVTFEVWPESVIGMPCKVTGTASWGGLTFTGDTNLGGGQQVVELKSNEKLPDQLARLVGDIQWAVDNGADPEFKNKDLVSWGHEIFVTVGKALTDRENTVDAAGRLQQEDGVTPKRMRAAIEWATQAKDGTVTANPLDPHEVMVALRTRFPEYTLVRSKKVPEEHEHPKFIRNRTGGPWPLIQYFAKSAECQAQVRLERAILRQLGYTAEIKLMLVYALPGAPTTAKEDDWDAVEQGGLNDDNAGRVKGGLREYAFLGDAPPVAGKKYQQHDKDAPGLNHFEACLRLVARGVTRYYGGGGGVYATIDDVINGRRNSDGSGWSIEPCFDSLIWIEADNDGEDSPFTVVEIVKRYSQGGRP
jgi:hypothetical protein